jgi:hypothetical protein
MDASFTRGAVLVNALEYSAQCNEGQTVCDAHEGGDAVITGVQQAPFTVKIVERLHKRCLKPW